MSDAVEKLSGKLGLDTTDFKTAISSANRELRVLESGFKASAAALGDWAKDATGLESRVKSLTSQIDIQKLKVAALAAEHQRLVQENGANSRAAQDAEIKLNKETETLNKMERELGDTEAALQEMRSGSDEASESVEDLGEEADDAGEKLVTFQDVLSGVGTITKATIAVVIALVAAVAAVGAAIGGLVFSSADAAAQLVDLSTKTGISTTRLQEMDYIANQVGTSLDTITGAQARLVRSMASAQDGTGEQTKAFKDLGISVKDAEGNLRNTQDVFDDVIDALGKIENPAERDALAMQLFGKSAQELNPLIKAGADEMARLADQAHQVGAVMSEEDVAALEAFDDSMASLKAGLKGTLGTLAAEFLPIAELVAGALQDLFRSDEFKQGMVVITQALEGFVALTSDVLKQLLSGDLSGALTTLFGADNASTILSVINTISSFIGDTLIPFATTHAQEIKAALIGIAGALGAAGLIAAIAGIVAAINPVTLIIGAIILAVGLLRAAWEGNWGGMRDRITEFWAILQPLLQQLWNWLSTNIPAAIQALSSFWTGTLLPAIQSVWSFLSANIFPLFQALGDFIGAVFNLYLRVMAGLWQNILLPALQEIYKFLDANVFPVFRKIGDYISGTFRPVVDSLASFLKGSLTPAFNGITSAIRSAVDWIESLANKINNLELPTWLTPGSPTPWEIGLIGINRQLGELNLKVPTLAQNLSGLSSGAGIPGSGGSSSVQNDQFQFFAPVVIQDTQPGGVGGLLKGKRF